MECDSDSDSESDCDSEPESQSDSESEPEPVTQPPPRRCSARLAALAPAAPTGPPLPLDSEDPMMLKQLKDFSMHSNPSATPAFAATHMRAGMFLAMRQACNRAREYGVLQNPNALYHLI
ncbi:hypothetical protein QJQ45_008343 [Haematococcus lacustris]|nr:hypothetical protein QJQ45_008343 [Haematococcus lacustris]